MLSQKKAKIENESLSNLTLENTNFLPESLFSLLPNPILLIIFDYVLSPPFLISFNFVDPSHQSESSDSNQSNDSDDQTNQIVSKSHQHLIFHSSSSSSSSSCSPTPQVIGEGVVEFDYGDYEDYLEEMEERQGRPKNPVGLELYQLREEEFLKLAGFICQLGTLCRKMYALSLHPQIWIQLCYLYRHSPLLQHFLSTSPSNPHFPWKQAFHLLFFISTLKNTKPLFPQALSNLIVTCFSSSARSLLPVNDALSIFSLLDDESSDNDEQYYYSDSSG